MNFLLLGSMLSLFGIIFFGISFWWFNNRKRLIERRYNYQPHDIKGSRLSHKNISIAFWVGAGLVFIIGLLSFLLGIFFIMAALYSR